MAKQDARKQFVQARLKALGGDATPEQRVKLRQRFNKLSETKEGRTRIAQVVLPSGTAEQRKALKQSLKPTKTSTTSTGSTTGTGSTTTTGSTTGTNSKSKVVNPGYVPGYVGVKPKAVVSGSTTPTTLPKSTTSTTLPRSTTSTTIVSDGNTPKNNSQSSAVIPSAKKTNVYGDTWEEKVALKLENWGVPLFGRVAGIGRAYDEGETRKAVEKTVAAGLDALLTGATFGGAVVGGTIIKNKFPGGVGPTNQTSLRIENTQYKRDIAKLQNEKFGAQRGLMGHTTPGGIRAESSVQALQGKLGGPTDYPVRSAPRAHLGESKWATDQASGATGPAFYERNNPIYGPELPKTPITTPKPSKPTATTTPKAPSTTTPKAPSTTTPKKTTTTTTPKAPTTTVAKAPTTTAPKSTTPTTVVAGKPGSVYDQLGTRTSGSYRDPKPGDPEPTKPAMPRGLSKADRDLWKNSDAMYDYENALYAWRKFNPKK